MGQDSWKFDGKRMLERRKYCRLTQKQLAKLLGTSQPVICEYETGRSEPSLKTFPRLVTAIHTSADYLLGLTDNPNPPPFSAAMTFQETELLQLFYSLPPQRRERTTGILIGLREGETPTA